MISSWILGGIVLIALVSLIFGKKLKWLKFVLIIAVVAFLYVSVTQVLHSDNYDFSNPKGIFLAVQSYVSWTGNTIKEIFEIGKDTIEQVGEAVKFEDSEMNS